MKLLNGDCLSLMAEIPDSSINLVIADLPYGLTSAPWDRRIDFTALWQQWRRIVVPCGVILLFAQQPFTTDVINSNRRQFKYCWYWLKNNRAGGLYAHSQPMRQVEDVAVFQNLPTTYNGDDNPGYAELRAYMVAERERCKLTDEQLCTITGKSSAARHYFNNSQWILPTEAAYSKLQQATGAFKRPWHELKAVYDNAKGCGATVRYHPPGIRKLDHCVNHNPTKSKLYHVYSCNFKQLTTGHPTNVLRYNVPVKRIHQTQKPVSMLTFFINTYTDKGDTVLDPCMGSGSTALAAMDTDRNFIGMELDTDFYTAALARIERHKEEGVQLELCI